MFTGILRKNKPTISNQNPWVMGPENEPPNCGSTFNIPGAVPVADNALANLETPPPTPASQISMELQYIVEKMTDVEPMIVDEIYDEENVDEISSDETLDSEATETDEEGELKDLFSRNGHKMFSLWFYFWLFTISIGLFAYHLNHRNDLTGIDGRRKSERYILHLMPRKKWDDSKYVVVNPTTYVAQRVVVTQTDTESCDNPEVCTKLLNRIKRQQGMYYNFLLASDGCIYEALGWQEPSPLYPGMRTMVVAFIGHYEFKAPSTMQMTQMYSLMETSEDLKHLASSYKIIGKKSNDMPSKLFAYLSTFDRWDKENSDSDDYPNIDFDYEPFPVFEY